MKTKILSLSKNKDFKSILTGKKVSNKYLSIFFKKLSDKSIKKLNISFIVKKKIGNAVIRNKIKRRLKNIMNQITKISKVNFEYSYLIIVKQSIIGAEFIDIKNVLIKEYIKIANDIGLDCIIETHTLDEINRALKIDYPIIGINNRNLDNLSVNINNTLDMINKIPKSFTVIGESGIKSNENIKKYNDHGVYNFLIGETILRSSNYDSMIKKLLKK